MTSRGRVIVTGGGGFLGRALVARLRAGGGEVLAPSRANLDWRDATAVARLIAAGDVAVLYHLASSGVSNRDADDPAILADELAMARAIAAAVQPETRIVFAGSMAEYGSSGRLAESQAVAPVNGYARAKVEAGRILHDPAVARGGAVIHARIFGLYGPGEGAGRLLPAIAGALRDGRPIALSDGIQRRDFVHVDDTARALAALGGLRAGPAIVNVGTGVAREVRAVALALARELGADAQLLQFGTRTRSPHDQDVLEADPTLLAETIGWVPPQRLDPLAGAILAQLGPAEPLAMAQVR